MYGESSLRSQKYEPFLYHKDARRTVVAQGEAATKARSKTRITYDLPVVRRGLDTLRVSFWLEWIDNQFFEILEQMKLIVQGTEMESIPVFNERGFDWNLYRTGTSKYAFRLQSGDVTLLFNRRKADGVVPTCRMEIGSLSCWSPGFYVIYERVKSFLACYGATISKERVSEAHLAADFLGVDIKSLDLDNQEKWISRATDFNPHYKNRKFTGMDMGKGNMMLRIYDKVTELKRTSSHHKQEIFAEIWGVSKFDEQEVTRVEYQIRRPRLREFSNDKKRKIDTVKDLMLSLKSLWQYLTSEWTKHTDTPVNRNHNQGKARLSEFWEKVRAVVWSGVYGLVRNHQVKHRDIVMLRKQARGILMTVCASLEVEPDDIDKIVYLCKELIEEDLHQFLEDEVSFINRMRTKRNEARLTLAG